MENPPSVAVIVPIFKDSFSDYEKFTFYNNAKVLSNRNIHLVGPKRLENYIEKLSKTIENGKVTIFDDYFFNNTLRRSALLMMDISYYQSYIEYDYILICHFDAIVFQDNLDYWTSQPFDNIGAPLFNNNYPFQTRPGNNGGLCLRKISSCIKVLTEINYTYSNISSIWKLGFNYYDKCYRVIRDVFIYNYKWIKLRPVLHEDLFWSVIVPDKFSWFKNAPFDTALHFAFEEKPKILHKLTDFNYPLGIHAWWKFDEHFCAELIQKKFPETEVPGFKTKVFKDDYRSSKIAQ